MRLSRSSVAKAQPRSSRFRIFPVAVFGKESRNSIVRGYLYAASFSRQNAMISSELHFVRA